MPLIKDGAEAENLWAFVDGEDVPSAGSISVPLPQLLEHADTLLARNEQIGVRLAPADDPHDLAPYLDRIALIEIEFPKYTDGRGYSQYSFRHGAADALRRAGYLERDFGFLMGHGDNNMTGRYGMMLIRRPAPTYL